MNISKIESINEAFIIESTDLNSIDKLLNELPGNSSFSIETSDGFKRDFESIEGVLSHENSSKNSIQKITINKYSNDPYLQLNISFKINNSHGISYFFSADDENLIPKFQRVIDLIEGTEAWYSKWTKRNFILDLILGIGLLFILLSILPASGIIQTSNVEASTQNKAIVNLVIIGIIAATFLIGLLLNKIRTKIFPAGVFAIGQGIRRHRDIVSSRKFVLWGFGLFFSAAIGYLFFIFS
ncbi:MAG: hypothetical protein U5K72_05315 [Balneolaceae bacterium]|nr:hypothetical protein [Balneolaceae bacterium]